MKRFFSESFAEAGVVFLMLAVGLYWVNVGVDPEVLDYNFVLIGILGIFLLLIGVVLSNKPVE